jgi:Ion channel
VPQAEAIVNRARRVSRAVDRAARARRRSRFAALLLALVVVFAIQGIANPGRWEQVIVSILLAMTLVLSMRVAEVRPPVMRFVVGLGAVVLLLSLAEAIADNVNGVPVRLGNLLLVALAPPAVIVGIVRTLRAENEVTIEAVFGVLAVYLLLGMFFAQLYGVIGRINGTFFAQDVRATTSNYLYFSFTTLTTVGYGDLTAASNLGHTLAVSEALFGQIYLVTVVSVIVGNLRRRQPTAPARTSPPQQE